MEKIVVVGSSNTDLVIKVEKLPAPGETVIGSRFSMAPGGKGANQAVAVARLGGDVTFITKLAPDMFGNELYSRLVKEKINPEYIVRNAAEPSGVALIYVDRKGGNTIAVAPGANGTLVKDTIDQVEKELAEARYVLMQLEIPVETVDYVAHLACRNRSRVILNPAPATRLPDDLYRKLYLITPNETEAESLTGLPVKTREDMEKAAGILLDKGVENVVITLGAQGSFLKSRTESRLVSARKVTAVDTTAAGDVFNGALVVALSEGRDLAAAVEFATRASAISVTRNGAQPSIPYRHEVDTAGL